MTLTTLLAALLVGGGLGLMLSVQPIGRPRAHLQDLLEERTSRAGAGRRRVAEARAMRGQVFDSALLNSVLGGPLLRAGALIDDALGRWGVGDSVALARNLRETESPLTVASFRGQQLMLGLCGLGVLPLFGLIGFTPFGSWPWPLWLGPAALGAFMPVIQLKQNLGKRRALMQVEMLPFVNLLSLRVSGGRTIDAALTQAARMMTGPLGRELERIAGEAETGGPTLQEGLVEIADRTGLDALYQIVMAWQNSRQYGTPVAEPLTQVGNGLRQKEELAVIEFASKAQLKMLGPLAGVIFPAFLVTILFPVGAQMLSTLSSI